VEIIFNVRHVIIGLGLKPGLSSLFKTPGLKPGVSN